MALEPPALMEEFDLDDMKGQTSHRKVRHGTYSEPTGPYLQDSPAPITSINLDLLENYLDT